MDEPRLAADLAGWTRDVPEEERYEAHVDGGGRRVFRQAVLLAGTTATMEDAGLRLDFHTVPYDGDLLLAAIEDRHPAVYAQATPTALRLPGDWRGWRELAMELAGGFVPLCLDLVLCGARSRLVHTVDLAAEGEASVAVALHELPLVNGIEPSWSPTCLRLVPRWEGEHAAVVLRDLALVGCADPAPVLDRWGQRISTTWPGKVTADVDLVAAREAETVALAGLAPPADRSIWGGTTTLPTTAATGFFRVEQDADGRWWYRDPDGHAFWSFGPTCIRRRDNTPVAGREILFADLPDRTALPEVWDDAGHVRFLGTNLLRKYGSFAAWGERIHQRLGAWGCNTVANWSDVDLLRPMRTPYVLDLSTRSQALCRPQASLPDVDHPLWTDLLRERFAVAAAHQDDPWLIGWFVDNELAWGSLPADEAGDYAERYFATVRTLLKQADPNHLYLGCRFVRNCPHPDIVRAAGRHVDVLSVNAYSLLPRREDFDRFHDLAGAKPIQIGEHQLALRDPRQPPPLWPAFTAAERQRCWVAYDRAAASLSYCVGSHWFQFADQAGTGRSSNGENMLIGLVDITDRPYPHMVAAARVIGAAMYAWHASA